MPYNVDLLRVIIRIILLYRPAADNTMTDSIERLQETHQMVDHEILQNLWKNTFHHDNPSFVPRHLKLAVSELDEPLVSCTTE
jgi:hypothetical protein